MSGHRIVPGTEQLPSMYLWDKEPTAVEGTASGCLKGTGVPRVPSQTDPASSVWVGAEGPERKVERCPSSEVPEGGVTGVGEGEGKGARGIR